MFSISHELPSCSKFQNERRWDLPYGTDYKEAVRQLLIISKSTEERVALWRDENTKHSLPILYNSSIDFENKKIPQFCLEYIEKIGLDKPIQIDAIKE